jgi:excisionase family DNA binding protein
MQTKTTENRALSIADAAKALTLSERTIWRMIENGKIKSVKVSERRRVITAAEVARILAGGVEAA